MKKSIVKYVNVCNIKQKSKQRGLLKHWLAFVSVFSLIIFTIVYVFSQGPLHVIISNVITTRQNLLFLCFHVLIFIGFIYGIQFLKMGGMSKECDCFYKRLYELLADKRKVSSQQLSQWSSKENIPFTHKIYLYVSEGFTWYLKQWRILSEINCSSWGAHEDK